MISEATVNEVTLFTPTEVQQQVFTLSWLSGVAANGQLNQVELQTQLDGVAAHIGAWNVVWGPQITTDSGTVDNSMFVAQAVDAAQPTFVVAIAGTNPLSLYDWFSEDLDITPMNWPYASGAGQVTTGDSTGLANLLGMEYNGKTLQEFLSAIPDKSSVSLTFTGHSLGGALAPMLTLALMDPASTLNATNDVNIGNWAEVSLLATAGPSIGDSTFLQYFNATLANASCTFIWNGNDIVPHSWNKSTMMELTSPTNIYNLTLEPTQCLSILIARQQANANACNYMQFEPTPAFSGSLQPYTSPAFSIIPWTPESKFLAQAVYQHVNAYATAFNCTGWIQPKGGDTCAEPGVAALLAAVVNKHCQQTTL